MLVRLGGNTAYGSLDKSLSFFWRQIAGGLPSGRANPNRNGGSSKPSPINFFTAHDRQKVIRELRESKFQPSQRLLPVRFDSPLARTICRNELPIVTGVRDNVLVSVRV